MRRRPRYDLEESIFVLATDGLALARAEYGVNRSGLEAIIAAMRVAKPYVDGVEGLMENDPEQDAYFRNLGRGVEMALDYPEQLTLKSKLGKIAES